MDPVNSSLSVKQTKKPPSIITLPSAAQYYYLKGSDDSVTFDSFNKLLKSKGIHLNPQQKAILQCPSEHVMVNSLAGTWKTSSLIALAAYQAYRGI